MFMHYCYTQLKYNQFNHYLEINLDLNKQVYNAEDLKTMYFLICILSNLLLSYM